MCTHPTVFPYKKSKKKEKENNSIVFFTKYFIPDINVELELGLFKQNLFSKPTICE